MDRHGLVKHSQQLVAAHEVSNQEENASMIIVSDINCISSGALLIIITGITQEIMTFYYNHEVMISGLI